MGPFRWEAYNNLKSIGFIMITLVGVGHVFDIAAQVKQVIRERGPGAVCIELDQERYEALRHPREREGVPLPYKLLAFMQKRMARQYGGEVGNEMLAAADEAEEINASLLLIDAEAGNLFNRLWQEMSFRERVLLMVSSVGGLLMSAQAHRQRDRELPGQRGIISGADGPGVPHHQAGAHR